MTQRSRSPIFESCYTERSIVRLNSACYQVTGIGYVEESKWTEALQTNGYSPQYSEYHQVKVNGKVVRLIRLTDNRVLYENPNYLPFDFVHGLG